MDAKFTEFQLESQFRCNGSAAYLEWLDDMLGITQQDQQLKLVTPSGYNFKTVNTPEALLAEVCNKNAEIPNSARLVAGWCWPWSDPSEFWNAGICGPDFVRAAPKAELEAYSKHAIVKKANEQGQMMRDKAVERQVSPRIRLVVQETEKTILQDTCDQDRGGIWIHRNCLVK